MLWKLLLVGSILLLLFGSKRLGEIGKGLGEGIRNFKKALGDEAKPPAEGAARQQLPARQSSEDDSP